ncbi:MAG: hypothetical protein HYY06_21700 [Deltaproteobacteria bacterium]|nr:hypothetical protein [Deltaproteobacteria bacterium]
MVRPLLRQLLAMAIVGSTAGCLITDRVEFEDPENLPPLIESMAPPAAKVVRLDRTRSEDVSFACQVLDQNEEDTLDARAFLDFARDEAIRGVTEVVQSESDARRRSVTASFPPDLFARGCHVVEVDVIDGGAAGWDPGGQTRFRSVKEGVAKATATWFVLAYDSEGDPRADISLESCP